MTGNTAAERQHTPAMLTTPLFGPDGNATKADPTDARITNRLLLFSTLFPRTQISRAAMARETGLSRMAVTKVVQELIDEHLFLESGQEHQTGRGKRGTLLTINPDYWRNITVDLSQPYLMQGAITNLQAQVLERIEKPLNASDALRVEDVIDLCKNLVTRADSHVLGIGISMPGIVDSNGRILYSTSFNWSDLDLKHMLEDALSIPVHIDNDANCALIAERFFGEHKSNLFFVQITRGVGAATLINDTIVLGTDQTAGEIGHVRVKPDGPLCSCGKRGCLETLISANALHRRIDADPDKRNDILVQAGTYLGEALSIATNLLDIKDVSVYGPPDLVNATLLESAEKTLNENTLLDYSIPTRVHRCQCGSDTAFLGETVAVTHHAIRHLML